MPKSKKEDREENKLIKKILEDSKKNVKEVDISSFEEEIKKRAPGFSEEITVHEKTEKIEIPANVEELINKELNSRLKIIDEFISKKLGEVDSKLRELERYSSRIDNIESTIIKLQTDINKIKETTDSRYIDLEKEIHRIETSVKQNLENLRKEFDDKYSVLELKLKTIKDHTDALDREVSSLKESYNRLKEVTKDLAEKVASKILEFQELRKMIDTKLTEIEEEIKKLKLEERTVKGIKERINLFRKELDKLEKEIEILVSKSKPEIVFEQDIEVKQPAEVETKEKVPEGAEVKEESLKTEQGEKKHKHIRLFGRK